MSNSSVYLAVDLGAGSGRVIAGVMLNGNLLLEEVNRFENQPVEKGAKLYWDFDALWAGVLEGLKLSVDRFGAANICSIGVDTWGVDYGLLDVDGKLLAGPRNYRDPRTKGMMADLFTRFSAEAIFGETGIQFIDINTLPQMCAEVKDVNSVLPQADQFLMIPDLINHRLTGEARCERTNASTTQLYNPLKKDWSRALFEAVGLSLKVAPDLIEPGQVLGMVRDEIASQTGLSPETKVVTVGSHDTASAVAAVPAEEGSRFAYLSSGTWSLLGVEIDEPILTPLAREYNFTNEVGVFDTIRLLKNINGLWLVQECRRVWKEKGNDWSYLDLAKMAAGAERLQSFIDPDDARFTGRCDMPQVIADFCRESGQIVPDSPAQILRLVSDSLAMKVRFVLQRLEKLIGYEIDVVHIIGGGGQNDQLNKSIASSINRPVIVGPYEATAAGNLMMQKVACGELSSLEEGRALIRKSFETKHFEPAHPKEWSAGYECFLKFVD
ncbi:MAG: rhamnulokinase [Akkermansiaceae bacterium]|jgi:rhamnulokinase